MEILKNGCNKNEKMVDYINWGIFYSIMGKSSKR